MMQHNTPVSRPACPCQDLLGERITCPGSGLVTQTSWPPPRPTLQSHNNHIICCHHPSPPFKSNAYLKFPIQYAEVILIFKVFSTWINNPLFHELFYKQVCLKWSQIHMHVWNECNPYDHMHVWYQCTWYSSQSMFVHLF